MQAELVLALDLVGCIFCTSQCSGPLPPPPPINVIVTVSDSETN